MREGSAASTGVTGSLPSKRPKAAIISDSGFESGPAKHPPRYSSRLCPFGHPSSVPPAASPRTAVLLWPRANRGGMLEQPRSDRPCSFDARTVRSTLESGGPHASRTSYSLDTGGGLLHGNLRRDPARSSRRTVTRSKSAVHTQFAELPEWRSPRVQRQGAVSC